ncbi:hypothetical protein H4219_000696 [Mycoemilia scoparia]|uniref:Transcription initiation factor TFIID subunit 8 n=1 Tax=Mycoemilia scoparia TaxID=417184 RepID=A0A9W8ABD3_9FUNG|nr:hypothetical protein H4219_000696 [Mycoemilia scoparia]
MQELFAHAQSFGELATRTRPNLNDVGKVLDLFGVSTGSLEEYLHKEVELFSTAERRSSIYKIHKRIRKSKEEATKAATISSPPGEADCLKLIKSMLAYRKETHDLLSNANKAGESDSEFEQVEEQTTGDNNDGVLTSAAVDSTGMDIDGNENNAIVSHPKSPASSGLSRNESAISLATNTKPATEPTQQKGVNVSKKDSEKEAEEPSDSAQENEDDILISPKVPDHIPEHLPELPSSHTYRQTPVFPKRSTDTFLIRKQKTEQGRQAEENLQKLVLISRSNLSLSKSIGVNNVSDSKAQESTQKRSSTASSEEDTAPNGGRDKKSPQKAIDRLTMMFPPANYQKASNRQKFGYIDAAKIVGGGNDGVATNVLTSKAQSATTPAAST